MNTHIRTNLKGDFAGLLATLIAIQRFIWNFRQMPQSQSQTTPGLAKSIARIRALALLLVCGWAASGLAIESGECLQGVIATPAQATAYQFAAVAGDTVQVRMTSTNGLASVTELRGPGGQVLASGASRTLNRFAEFTVTVTNSGTFTIICKDAGTATGSYSVSMIRMTGYPLAASDPELGTIASGQALTGTIDRPADLDAATFTASAGDTVQVRMTGTNGLACAAELRGPGGQLLASGGSWTLNRFAEFTVTVTNSGTFTIICKAGADSSAFIGSYSVSMLRMPGYPLAASDPDLGAIGSGQTLTGTIDKPADLDAATFTASAGDTVQIRMASTNGLAPSVELRGPDGQLQGANGYRLMPPNPSEVTVKLTNSGIFTIICKVGTDSFAFIGSYSVSMLRMPGYPLAASDPDLGTIGSGQTLTGTIDRPADLDAATFSATAGDTVQVRMTSTNGLACAAEMWGPGGQLLASGGSWTLNRFAEFAATVTNSGTFTIICKSSGISTGSYSVSMIRMTGYPLAANDPDLGPIASGQTLIGTIDKPADLDAATFTATAGDTVQLRMTSTNGMACTSELRGPGGQVLASGGSWTLDPFAEFTVTVSNSGTLTVICKAGEDSSVFIGSYWVSMLRLTSYPLAASDPDLGTIVSGQTLTGTIDKPADLDAATFTASAGDTVQVRMASTNGLAPSIELRGQSGQLLASRTGNPAEVAVTLTNSGTFTIICKGASTSTGTYGLSLLVFSVNAAPSNITLSNPTVLETQPSGTAVGTLSATDPNTGDTFTYTLVTGTGSTDNASFTNSGSNLLTAAIFNYEVKSNYTVRVRTTDQGGLWFEKAFTISVLNTNETPTDIALSNASVAEHQLSGTIMGAFSTTDPDLTNTFTYTLVTGTGSTDNASFTIGGSNLLTAAIFNYEVKSNYTVRVRTTDQGGLWFEKAFTITILNTNETPTVIAPSNSSVVENRPSGTTVGIFSTTDPDLTNTFTCALVTGTGSTDNTSFTVSGSNLLTAAVFNYEVKSNYTIRVRTTDQGGLWFEKAFTISVLNTNETPTDIALSNASVAEHQLSGTIMGAFSTTDPDLTNTFTYTLVTGTGSTDNASFSITGSNLLASASFHFEVKSNYTVRVRATDQGGLWFERAFPITVLALGTPLVITQPPTNQIVSIGGTANFAVTATGTGPLSYQWRFNGINLANGGRINGATNAMLTILNVQTNDAGSYSVLVSNVVNTSTSSVAVLTVLGASSGNDFCYVTNGAAIEITCYKGPGGGVAIPSMVTGLPVRSIGAGAFNRCSTITSIAIPISVGSIGDCAFQYCENLADVSVPSSVTNIGYAAFQGAGLTNVAIPQGVIYLGDYAFAYCANLTSVTIPTSVSHIGDFAFNECSKLTSIAVAAGNPAYSSIGGVLFNSVQTTLIQYPCGKAQNSYSIPTGITNIGRAAFDYCINLGSVSIPDTVLDIGRSAFIACLGLTNVTMGNGVLRIGENAFWGCSQLTSVMIGESVTSIGAAAFTACGSLVTIALPSSLSSIGGEAFSVCGRLRAVYCLGNAPSVGLDVFYGNSHATVYYRPGKTGWGATLGGRPTALWSPLIKITSVPAYGSSGVMQGSVSGAGVNFADCRVAPYIQIEGVGWWSKPTFAMPTVAIASNGTFTVNVATGGMDSNATIFCAALMPAAATPTLAAGSSRIPLDANVVAVDFLERYARIITFAGRSWGVKDAPAPVGPGPNCFSSSASDVWVDASGLHLTIHQDTNGVWWSSEVVLLSSLGYGVYTYKTMGPVNSIDVNATLGMFTWDAIGDDSTPASSWFNRELDFEDSRWGVATDPNSQAVVQPYYRSGYRHRFNLPTIAAGGIVTRILTWRQDYARFHTLAGNQSTNDYPDYPAGTVLDDWTFVHNAALGQTLPTLGKERIRFNFWLNNPSAGLAIGKSAEVVITDFSFMPLPASITAIQKAGNDAFINFNSIYGKHYTLQSRTNLASGTWMSYPGFILGNGGVVQAVDTNALKSLPQRFYRIRQEP